ncbi:hypothetical protein D9M72_526190 [compost metagenome]
MIESNVFGLEKRVEGVLQLRRHVEFQPPRAGEKCVQLPDRIKRRVVEKRLQLLQVPLRQASGNRLQQRLLRNEIVVEGALGDIGLTDDVVDRRILVAVLEEQPLGTIDQLVRSDFRRFFRSDHKHSRTAA